MDMNDSEVKECKELNYKLLQRGHFQVKTSNGGFKCPFCPGEDEDDYSHLLQHAIREAEEGPTAWKHRPKHASMARYLAADLATELNAHVSGETSRKRSRSDSSSIKSMALQRGKEAIDKVGQLQAVINSMQNDRIGLFNKLGSYDDVVQRFRSKLIKKKKEALENDSALRRKISDMRENMHALVTKERMRIYALMKREQETLHKLQQSERKIADMRDTMISLISNESQSNDELKRISTELIEAKALSNRLKENYDLEFPYQNLPAAREGRSHAEVRDELMDGSKDWFNIIGIKKIGEIDVNAFKRACRERFPAEDAEIRGVELCSMWQAKLSNPSWHPFRMVDDNEGSFKAVEDASLSRLKEEWGDEAYNAVVTCIKDLHEYESSGKIIWNFEENRKAKLEEAISWLQRKQKSGVTGAETHPCFNYVINMLHEVIPI